MKIALLGNGRTGKFVLDYAKDAEVFNEQRIPTTETLKECDVIISFLPGAPFVDLLPTLLESKLPIVTGSTGVEFPKDLSEKLQSNNQIMIHAHNFSLGMNVVRLMIQKMSALADLFPEGTFNIHEVHHVHKIDGPSGTAISFKNWLDREAKVSFDREGDVVGHHKITFESLEEKVTLVHDANSRAIFAKGAVWAAQYILDHQAKLAPGLYQFNELIFSHLKKRGIEL